MRVVSLSNWRLASKALLRHHSRATTTAPLQTLVTTRTFAKLTPPGADPLEIFRNECFQRGLCDESGYRLPGAHWVFYVAVASQDSTQPPILRTVGVQRAGENGVDFVGKKNGTTKPFKAETPVSILHSHGKYVPGEQTEQWRAEGHCEEIPLLDIIHKVPHYTVTGMVASERIAKELPDVTEGRTVVTNKSHLTDIVQQTRIELEKGDISNEELANCITAYRFIPDRMERMVGGPDAVLWDRWEWERGMAGDCPEGITPWNEPKWLLPH